MLSARHVEGYTSELRLPPENSRVLSTKHQYRFHGCLELVWYGQEKDECFTAAILQCCGRCACQSRVWREILQSNLRQLRQGSWVFFCNDVVLALWNFSEWHKNLVSYVLINMWVCASEQWCLGTWSWSMKKCLHKCRGRSRDTHLAVWVFMQLRPVGVWKFKRGSWIRKDKGLKGERSWCGCAFRIRSCYLKRRLDNHKITSQVRNH